VIKRRGALLVVGVGSLFAGQLSRAQVSETRRRVGLVFFSPEVPAKPFRAGFVEGMRELGWIDGKNLDLRVVYANGDVAGLDALVAALISYKVEVMVVTATATVNALRHSEATVPVVFTALSNVVGNGIVASLAKPGGNMTGISNQYEDILPKLVELLHIVVPSARRFSLLVNESNLSHVGMWAAMKKACADLGLIPLRAVASSPAQVADAVQEIMRQRSDAVVVEPDPMYLGDRTRLQALMRTTGLPVAYGFREHVVAGGLLSYASDFVASFRQAAGYVDKILKGVKAADLPVEQPTKFELVINLLAAKSLGITIPQSVLLRVDELIR
jgi:putative ABC transport system substrate-binding protein